MQMMYCTSINSHVSNLRYASFCVVTSGVGVTSQYALAASGAIPGIGAIVYWLWLYCSPRCESWTPAVVDMMDLYTPWSDGT